MSQIVHQENHTIQKLYLLLQRILSDLKRYASPALGSRGGTEIILSLEGLCRIYAASSGVKSSALTQKGGTYTSPPSI